MTTSAPENHNSRYVQLTVIASLLVCTLVYMRGLFGGFFFDDFGNIVDNPALRSLNGTASRWIALAFSSNAGVLRRPLSMLSFGMDYRLFGLSALAFKCVNLAIHLVNGVLIYVISRRLAPRLIRTTDGSSPSNCPELVALFAASLWLLHPLNVSGVVYVVQRMNELATLFTLLGLLCYVEGRQRVLRGQSGMFVAFAGLCLFGLLATLSKENGAMIMGYALVIEWVCYGFVTSKPGEKRAIWAFFGITIALPVLLFLAYITVHPQWLVHGYIGRDFTLPDRLMSEARILWIYLLWIAVPLPSWMGIFHDDFTVSTSLLHPWTTVTSIIGLLAMVAIAWKFRHRSPGLMFAIAWFLVGHSMESTIIPLELIFEHRNYLPMAGLLLGSTCALAPFATTHLSGRRLIAACSVLLLAFAGLTAVRANDWSSQLRLAMAEVQHHPSSARAQYEAGRAIVFNGSAQRQQKAAEDEAIPYFERGKALNTTDIYCSSSLILIRGGRGMNIDSELSDLARRIREIKQPQINPFLVVMTAAIERKIPVSPEQMERLVDAAFDNPRFPPTVRAMILSNYGHYQFQVVHDSQSAISLTMAAAEQDPQNPLFQINLTKLALALGDSNEAAKHLQIAQRLNKAGLYDEVIANLKQRLPQPGR